MYYVYMISDPTGVHKPYIGKGSGNRLHNHQSEFDRGRCPNKRNYKLYNVFKHLKSLGLEADYVMLAETPHEYLAFRFEKAFMEMYGGLENLSNLRAGGKGGWTLSQETKDKISKSKQGSLMGEKNPMKRPEVRMKLSGENHWRHKHTEAFQKFLDAGNSWTPEEIEHLSKLNRGSNNPRAKITEETVRYIRENPKGISQLKLAKELGVSQALISNVVTRKLWKHL